MESNIAVEEIDIFSFTGRKVPMGKTSSARGPECFPRPTVESSIQYQGQSFCHTHRFGPLNNFFFPAGLFFFRFAANGA